MIFIFLWLEDLRNELNDRSIFFKIIENRVFARDVMKILLIFKDFLTL